MILLLAPGPHLVGPSPVQAAFTPADEGPLTIYDATGRGIGCQAGTRKYKGPGLPKDPPWPPGAAPTPSPSPVPSADPADPTGSSDPGTDPDASTEPTADAPMALVVATDVRLAQADLETEATPDSARSGSRALSGIDVSHHNGDIDYAKVREAGHRFVFIKATQDNDFIDPLFPTNLARARAAGLAAGAYHFFDYTLDGTAQANHFLDRVEAAGGIEGALPPVVDVECWGPIGASIHAVSTARLRDFVERVYERTGRMPIVYTSVHMWSEVVGNAEGFEGLPLWAACWGCDAPPDLAPGWDEWSFWQTGIDRIPGVGRLDGNFFGGNKRDLNALKLRPFSIEGGAIATTGDQVTLDLGGRDAIHIRTSPDGETWTKWSRIGSSPMTTLPAEEGEHSVFAQLRNGPGLKSPVVSDSIIVDRTPPEMSAPIVSLREGATGGSAASIPVAVRWQARDSVAGLSDAMVSVGCGEGRVERTEAPGSAAPGESADWNAAAMLFPDAACKVTAIARDGAGNETRDTVRGIEVSIVLGAGATDVSGDQVGVVARRGPDAGRAAVLLDGQPLTLIDLYAPEPSGPEIVYVADLPGQASISVEPTGSSDPASSGSAVIVDGFATLSR
jgi:GH25 family lysozyme M1 (1,4-beta-N-acetylmuramidase)